MKKFTAVFIACLIIAAGAMSGWVAVSPDFEPPAQFKQDIPSDNPIWNMTIADLEAYLVEKGVLDTNTVAPLSGGVATEAFLYDGSIELYWWDVPNLEEGTAEYKAYGEACESGVIDLWSMGYLMNVTVRGPFAFNIIADKFTGDAAQFEEAFTSFCAE